MVLALLVLSSRQHEHVAMVGSRRDQSVRQFTTGNDTVETLRASLVPLTLRLSIVLLVAVQSWYKYFAYPTYPSLALDSVARGFSLEVSTPSLPRLCSSPSHPLRWAYSLGCSV